MSYGLTDTGFIIKPMEVIRQELEDYQREHIDTALDFSDQSVISQLNASMSYQLALLWETALGVYSSQYPDTAVGFALTQVAAITGTKRSEYSNTTVVGQVTLNPNKALPAGSKAHLHERPSDLFETVTDVPATTAGGTFDVTFKALEPGSLDVLPGQLDTIAEPVSGWTAVTNAASGVPGSEPETDSEFRLKRERELEAQGGANLDAIRADVSRVDGVIGVNAYENVKGYEVNGMPPHSILITVRGGSDADVAEAIFNSKAAGIDTTGNTSVIVEDSQQEEHTIYFSRAAAVNFYADITIEPGELWDNSTDPDYIKEQVAAYVNSLSIGSDVIYYEVIHAIFNSEGVYKVPQLLIGLSSPPGSTGDIVIADNQYPEADPANISITVL